MHHSKATPTTALAYAESNMRVCKKCFAELPVSHFGKKSSNKDGLALWCKQCTNASNKEKRLANIDHHRQLANKRYAKDPQTVIDRVKRWRAIPENKERKNALERAARKDPMRMQKYKEYAARYKMPQELVDAHNERRRAARKNNPEIRIKEKAYRDAYYARDDVIQKTKEHRREWLANPGVREMLNAKRRNKYKSDPIYVCSIQIRAMVKRSFEKIGTKKQTNTNEIIGYSPMQLKQRLECQFKPGMSWHNKNLWHIDHKKPIAAFVKDGNLDVKTINMLCNLQPLWIEENQSKGGKWPLVAANDNMEPLNVAV